MNHNSPWNNAHLQSDLVQTHAELRRCLRRRRLSDTFGRLSARLFARMGLGAPPTRPESLQQAFSASPSWDLNIREALGKLPNGFITAWSLKLDSALWLSKLISSADFRVLVECGCGISTVLMALHLQESRARIVSLEQDLLWMERTRAALDALGLGERVELVHAPLEPVSFSSRGYQAHSLEGLGGTKADFLLIDAPPESIGRMGTLPHLSSNLNSGAVVVLDDASRFGEFECIENWCGHGLANLLGYAPTGNGLAILEAQ
jgi:hypothetical protein